MVPRYLRDISTELKVKGQRTTFAIGCVCGNDLFDVFVSTCTPEEKALVDAYWKSHEKIYRGCWAMMCTIDDDGDIHHWKFLAPFIKVEVFPPEMPPFAAVTCWKLRCSACGKEHLIFDNRIHGYGGVFCSDQPDQDYQPLFQQRIFRDHLPRRIEIITENERTIEEFRENTGVECDFDSYSNAFGWIGVSAIDSRGKRTRILESETA